MERIVNEKERIMLRLFGKAKENWLAIKRKERQDREAQENQEEKKAA